jgi:hypothetical protein
LIPTASSVARPRRRAVGETGGELLGLGFGKSVRWGRVDSGRGGLGRERERESEGLGLGVSRERDEPTMRRERVGPRDYQISAFPI